jgi:hypothetical protein
MNGAVVRAWRRKRHPLAEPSWRNLPGVQFVVVEYPPLLIVSTLCHTTVCPGGTVAGFGENDWLPLMPTTLIVIAPAGGADGLLGLVGDESP